MPILTDLDTVPVVFLNEGLFWIVLVVVVLVVVLVERNDPGTRVLHHARTRPHVIVHQLFEVDGNFFQRIDAISKVILCCFELDLMWVG